MEKTEKEKHRFGLVGMNISYSFSQGYFTQKFKTLGLVHHTYENFDLQNIDEIQSLFENTKDLKGLNVTIPYKEAVIPFLNSLSKKSEKIGAVNTVRITKNGMKGYNTDVYGFRKSIEPYLREHHKKALILGTGGASKAVAFVFNELGIPFLFVSRSPTDGQLSYSDLKENMLEKHTIIVNCSPLGTFPNVDEKPDIPYVSLSPRHLLFDLIYNPEKTAFLQEGERHGATICNGRQMLVLQAEKAWEIWNK